MTGEQKRGLTLVNVYKLLAHFGLEVRPKSRSDER
jgi:hypothetical protein